VRIGILGAAAIAPLCVLDPAAKLGHEVVVVAARDQTKARDFADRHGIPRIAGTYDDVINDPAVELVYNPLPNSAHALWNVKALRAGKHVLAEKPFTVNSAEARHVVEVARQSGRFLFEAYHYFHHPVMKRAMSLIGEGRIGHIRHVEVQMVSEPPAPGDFRWSAALAGGSLMDMGCYGIHLMQRLAALCGGPPAPESSTLIMDPVADGVDVASLAVLRFPEGATGSVWSDFRGHGDVLAFTVYGSKGLLRVPSFVAPWVDDRLIIETAEGVWTERLGTETSYTYQLEAVHAQIRDDRPFPLTLDDTLETMDMIDWVFANSTRHLAVS
jgi:predicted dehydrogenase